MENENAFKHMISPAVVKKIAAAVKAQHPSFNSTEFLKLIADLEPLEMKNRVLLITSKLKTHLPEDYLEALRILVRSMEEGDLSGFELWAFSEYISQFGLDHFDESLRAMYVLTQKFTAEFAVRPFLHKNHAKVFKYFSKWVTDKNVHVRRWVSEGSRPLLPWGMKLPLFVMDPTYTLILLEKLKFDDELYVRKSVANHLNDISKNHPQVVIEVLRLWGKDAAGTNEEKYNWIKRHALRTLIKKGHPGALKLMGIGGEAKIKLSGFKLNQKSYKLHDDLLFSFEVISTAKQKQKLIVDYAIDFMKANGKKGKKVFKLKTFELSASESVTLKKKHSLKPITTMKYYPGIHHLYLQVNGKILAELKFNFG